MAPASVKMVSICSPSACTCYGRNTESCSLWADHNIPVLLLFASNAHTSFFLIIKAYLIWLLSTFELTLLFSVILGYGFINYYIQMIRLDFWCYVSDDCWCISCRLWFLCGRGWEGQEEATG
jgi:hypothetical protein